MRSLRSFSFVVLAGILSSSCGGDSPASPSAPREITLVSNQPLSGATLTTGCAAPTMFLCTDDLVLTFDVSFDRTLQEVWLEVEFLDSNGRSCAGTVDRLAPLVSRVPSRATTRVTLMSSVPDLAVPRCEFPFTTTRLVATLVEGTSRPNARLLTREFDATYTFTKAP